jgi:hypothetical protein
MRQITATFIAVSIASALLSTLAAAKPDKVGGVNVSGGHPAERRR